ncbi:hypothetical protein GDO86_016105 [Hymenochirus boettgeri]|uniref:FHA domain-containing protein n=1 Tax=Hymenochirus boettgeri TaxID=247094 RepID=A0A8T2K427_9PIPI|nr:hypothetical protein GDO86_016105 [Hymenochirus boettgeri]
MPKNKMSVTSWFLVSSSGTRHRLPREMIFVGREDCELMLQSRSVDKQHAVINYDSEKDEHRVKDLGSLNGTFVNDIRIPDQKYVTLKLNDQIQHKVPEEALKHEKYTSHLQMSLKTHVSLRTDQPKEPGAQMDSSHAKQEKGDKKTASEHPIYRTPLYGQPSWWGEDEDSKLQKQEGRRQEHLFAEQAKEMAQRHEEELNGNVGYRESQDQSIYSFRREPSYFEIPTKDLQQPIKPTETQVHEIPTKDTDAVPGVTQQAMQSHASFTIEFDDCRPGKIKIKDHVTKFSMRQRRLAGKEAGPTEMVTAESKVADWLVQNDPSLMRRTSPEEDVYSTKSDLPIHNRTLKGNRHEDGTQSDSEDPMVAKPEQETTAPDHPQLQRQIKREPEELLHSQQAFVIEFFDEDAPRKKRSQSFTHNANSVQNDSDSSTLKANSEKRKVLLPAEKCPPNGTSSSAPGVRMQSSPSFPRSNSFRREKTEEQISPAPAGPRPPVRNFGSIGKKSKLAQEFATKYLREQTDTNKYEAEKPLTLALIPVMGQASKDQSIEEASDKRPMGVKNEEDETLSDAGTYTIETETQDTEVEQARNMIDQVFGVFEPEEYSRIPSTIYRPIISQDNKELVSCDQSLTLNPVKSLPPNAIKLNGPQTEIPVPAERSQKWVSRWASLADSYPDASPTSPMESQKQGLAADDGNDIEHTDLQGDVDLTLPSRTRRVLPQLPSESLAPTILVCQESFSEVTLRKIIEPEKEMSAENGNLLLVQEDLDPDSLSDTSKSDDGLVSIRNFNRASNVSRNGFGREECIQHESSGQKTSVLPSEKKPKYFYVGNYDGGSVKQTNSEISFRDGNKSLEEQLNVKVNSHSAEEPSSTGRIVNPFHTKESASTKDSASFVRQESFTKEKSSIGVSPNKLPHISTHPLLKDLSFSKGNHDYKETREILKETEDVLAALEAKFSQSHVEQLENTPCLRDDSLSGESDVDTASTVSLVSEKNVPSHPQKNRITNSYKEKSSSTSSIQDQYCQPSARDRLSEKRRTVPTAGLSRSVKRHGMSCSIGASGSLEFSDELSCSSLPFMPVSETGCSDYELSCLRPSRKTVGHSSSEGSSRNTQKVEMALTRSNSLSTPRPTRASKLRRARLGDSSDNEAAETERSNVSPGNSSAKSSTETKKPSRLDLLAMPRKRTGSFTVPSDSESSTSRGMFSGRSVEQLHKVTQSHSNRKSTVADTKQTKKPVALTQKQTPSRVRSSSAKYSSTTQTSRSSSVTRLPKSSGRQQEEEEIYNNTFAQSAEIAEIARLSQTLVKNVTSLAREIHDVAGDDSQSSSGTGQSTSISSVPNTPASTISAREEIIKQPLQGTSSSQLVHHIPEASLNYQKVPPGSTELKDFDQNMNDSREEDPSKRRARNREEVIFDNLMLNPVSQLSHTICSNTEILTEKMKIIFQNSEHTWEEIEAKINSENEVPILKTSNKPLTNKLYHVVFLLSVINAIIDPSGHLDVMTSNKKTSSAIKPTNPPSRTAIELYSFGQHQNSYQKSNSSSSRSPGSSFNKDDEDS